MPPSFNNRFTTMSVRCQLRKRFSHFWRNLLPIIGNCLMQLPLLDDSRTQTSQLNSTTSINWSPKINKSSKICTKDYKIVRKSFLDSRRQKKSFRKSRRKGSSSVLATCQETVLPAKIFSRKRWKLRTWTLVLVPWVATCSSCNCSSNCRTRKHSRHSPSKISWYKCRKYTTSPVFKTLST